MASSCPSDPSSSTTAVARAAASAQPCRQGGADGYAADPSGADRDQSSLTSRCRSTRRISRRSPTYCACAILAVHPSVPAKNLQELIAYVNTQKGKIQYASAGNGTPQHLTGELFKATAKLDMIHVPYKGSAPAITDLIGGHVPIMFDSAIAILPHIKSGKVNAIAITSAKRSSILPNVPTFEESGMKGSSPTRGTVSRRRRRQGNRRQIERRSVEGDESPSGKVACRDRIREGRCARAVLRS